MHGGMAGFYEVRVQGGGMNHRLFCVLERDADYPAGSSIVVIDGLWKPKRPAAAPTDYRRALRSRSAFEPRRTVLASASSPSAVSPPPVHARPHPPPHPPPLPPVPPLPC